MSMQDYERSKRKPKDIRSYTDDFEQAGVDFVRDWLCWNEKALAALPTVKEKKQYIQDHGQFESCAGDMGQYHPDTCDKLNEADASYAADYIYEGMCQAVKEYLATFGEVDNAIRA